MTNVPGPPIPSSKSRRFGLYFGSAALLTTGLVTVIIIVAWAAISSIRQAQQRLTSTEGQKLDDVPVADAGKTPEATLKAFYHYKDRGQNAQLRDIANFPPSLPPPSADGPGMSPRAQQLRGIALDHAEVESDRATLF